MGEDFMACGLEPRTFPNDAPRRHDVPRALGPPRDAAGATLRIATGLGAAIILAPATRWGYLVYPLALLGAMIGFASVGGTAQGRRTDRTTAGPTDDLVANPDSRGSQP